ncbi:serine hydrolase domain-containing protein [Phenylobacterium sp.]|uniref:serine hydrolase domain-containing protein n=1 Tax=Phenylobacterium sp. TaxID=1871053 RepID=UPI002D79F785|nr:serine hydrolase domain-containing protein [Phenylobacterium sp.]
MISRLKDRPISRRTTMFVVAFAAMCVTASTAFGAPLTPAESAQVDQIVAAALAQAGTPSASVAVVRDGQIAFAKAYGLRRIETHEAATADTRYRAASVSKQFTAAAVLMLADQGKFSLDDPLSRYLPELGAANHATIRQALSHTAGFPEFWTVDYVTPEKRTVTTPQAIVDRWGAEPPDFQPGSKFHYSNTNYVILGRLVEKVSGKPLDAFLQEHIFRPLSMTSAEDVDGKLVGTGDAEGYSRRALGPPRPAQRAAAGWTVGCGELSMTASDLARWDMAMLDRRLMSPRAYDAQQTAGKLTDGSVTGYGLGVFVDETGGHRRIRHNGDLAGYWSENRVYPDDKAAIVVMINGNYGGSPHEVIANGLEQMLLPPKAVAAGPAQPPSLDATVRVIFRQIMGGQLDRSLLSPDASDYLSGGVLEDYHRSFQELGPPLAFTSLQSDTDDGLQSQSWQAIWATATLKFTLRVRPDGKVEEFYVFPGVDRRLPPPELPATKP